MTVPSSPFIRCFSPKWITPTEQNKRRLEDANWVLHHMLRLLRLQRAGEYQLGQEGYLTHPRDERFFDRAITMSAWVGLPEEPGGVLGSKWVSSRPANIKEHLPRGRAVTVLNCGHTGLPLLAFDGTDLSNARTAAFACAAIELLYPVPPEVIGFLGAGRVHNWQAHYIRQLWPNAMLTVFDPDHTRATDFCDRYGAVKCSRWEEAVVSVNIVSIATAGGGAGWIPEATPLVARLWINTSLRDIQPRMIERFPLVVVDEEEFAASRFTPYHNAKRAGHVRYSRRLCDIPDLSYIEKPTLVNPMGLAIWDVGLGYAMFQEQFQAAAKEQWAQHDVTT